jgi:hypothetical protein
MKTTIDQRMQAMIIALGHNPNSFSSAIGYIPQTTHKYLKGKNLPGFEYLQAVLTTFPQINARWLITGEGQMITVKK